MIMKKFYSFFFPALAALALTACSSEDTFTQDDLVKKAQEAEGDAVRFDVYTENSTQTRALTNGGSTGAASTTEMKTGTHSEGFGVFAYLTKDNYGKDAANTPLPNFMYNEKVYWSTDNWKYDLIKYWPNGIDAANVGANPSYTATEDNTNAKKLSFFAYAPYISTGGSTGITSLPTNSAAVRPSLGFSLPDSNPTESATVDLLWGLRGQATYAETDNTDNTGAVGTDYNVNLTKQTVDERVRFLFKHALAKIGGIKVVYDIDGNSATPETSGFGSDDDNTLVTVESVTIKTGDATSVYKTGSFDISQGEWTLTSGTKYAAETSLLGSPTINPDIFETTPKYSSGWKKSDGTTSFPGVKASALTDMFSTYSPMMFIPSSNVKLEVEVEYVVRTYDNKLDESASGESGKWTKVTQKIKNNVTIPTLAANTNYTLVMHLGLTSVKFSAEVNDWDGGNTSVIWLPSNVVKTSTEVTVAAGSDDIVYTAADETSYTIKLNGLTASNKIAIATTGTGGATVNKVSNSDGSAEITASEGKYEVAAGETAVQIALTLTANNSDTTNKETTFTITETDGSSATVSTTVVKVVQYRKDS